MILSIFDTYFFLYFKFNRLWMFLFKENKYNLKYVKYDLNMFNEY